MSALPPGRRRLNLGFWLTASMIGGSSGGLGSGSPRGRRDWHRDGCAAATPLVAGASGSHAPGAPSPPMVAKLPWAPMPVAMSESQWTARSDRDPAGSDGEAI